MIRDGEVGRAGGLADRGAERICRPAARLLLRPVGTPGPEEKVVLSGKLSYCRVDWDECAGSSDAPMRDDLRMAETTERGSDATRRLRGRLIAAGLRPTRQRVALGELLFRMGHRHVTAEKLYEEAVAAELPVSLATVYNTLHQFTDVGLLREIAVDGARVYFDTNVSEHHHFLVEDGDALVDIPGAEVDIVNLPAPPPGMKIARVDVVVRLAKDD